MLNRVITISREFGSGGRTIGKRVAEKLGIPCYDAELIQKIAEERLWLSERPARARRLVGGNPTQKGVNHTTDSESWTCDGNSAG